MSPSSSSARQTPEAGKDVHALSCVNCRQRKVRCSKTYPCPHCLRGGLECIFPSRKKDRMPRRNNNHELLNRLAKLEAIVGQVNPKAPGAAAGSSRPGVDMAPPQPPPSATPGAAAESIDSIVVQPPTAAPESHQGLDAELRNPQKRCPATPPASRDDPAAKYVSGEFWANLSSEVEGIKAALEQPSEDEEDSDGGGHEETSPESVSQSSPNYYVTSPAIFGNAMAANAGEGLLHPAPEKMRRLCETYFRNVDPLIKILHRPTIKETFNRFLLNPVNNPLSRTTEALFFAMYFAAVTSLQPERCKALLGEDRGLLVVQYRQAAEYALARADYLNSTSLETLQAFTLYSTCLRNHSESRASWAMLALVLRLSQAIGLHRDSDGLAFSPYEAEMRRRLWSQIIVLDVRAASDRGSEPMVRQEEYNTLPPTNLNDDDFGPQTTIPLSRLAREGTTDATFCRCTYECSNLFLHIHGPRSRFSKADHHDTATSSTTTNTTKSLVQPQISEEDLVQRIKKLEDHFAVPTSPGNEPAHLHFQSALATSVIRIASLTYWLSIQYPFHVRQPVVKPRVSREHMLQTAVSILELKSFRPSSSSGAGTGTGGSIIDPAEYRERFSWWQDGYTQWHALAVALAELCVQTEGALVDRAWNVVEGLAPVFGDKVADARKGALWRPIRKLLRKARERRAEAQMRRLRMDGGGGGAAVAQQRSVQLQPHQRYQQPMTPQSTQAPSNTTAGATATRPPSNPATEAGPTGLPLAQDPGDVPDMGGTSWAAASVNLPSTTTNTPPAVILANGHINNWAAIDFGDLGTMPVDASMGGMEDLDMMDWTHWNEFVNDASVTFDDNHTSPSSEDT